MYYVYEWFIVETGEVIYVGKGTRNRYRVRKHNKFFNDMIKRHKCDSRIIKEFEDEKEAFSYEFERVNELKKIGQCACNIYDGGFGGTTGWWTNQMREKYSTHNAMLSAEQRERMSNNNPMKDKSIAEKVNSKKRIPVIIGDVEYPSIADAKKAFNVSSSTINAWCVKGETKSGLPCRYKNDFGDNTYRHRNDGQSRQVIYKGETYPSATALGIAIGVSQTTASRWCRQGRDTYGNPCRYIDDNRENATSPIKQKHIPVIVNGVWYASKEHASRQLGISSYLLTQYLDGKRKDTKYICKYGNQQPSRGNTDNSTSEGSTTNR
jgi:hypothetical protein